MSEATDLKRDPKHPHIIPGEDYYSISFNADGRWLPELELCFQLAETASEDEDAKKRAKYEIRRNKKARSSKATVAYLHEWRKLDEDVGYNDAEYIATYDCKTLWGSEIMATRGAAYRAINDAKARLADAAAAAKNGKHATAYHLIHEAIDKLVKGKSQLDAL